MCMFQEALASKCYKLHRWTQKQKLNLDWSAKVFFFFLQNPTALNVKRFEKTQNTEEAYINIANDTWKFISNIILREENNFLH